LLTLNLTKTETNFYPADFRIDCMQLQKTHQEMR